MLNIKKIAQAAGVSKSTVSRVINQHRHVNKETRQKVLDVIQQFDYIPNSNAVQLKIGKTNIIGVMTPLLNNYYMQYINGIALAGKQEGYQVLIYQTDERLDQEKEALELLRQKKVDGILILRRLTEWTSIEHYTKYGPIITSEPLDSDRIPSVYIDHYRGFQLGMEHLIHRGYQKIACTIGRQNSINSTRRIQAYSDLLQQYHLCQKEEWILSGVRTVKDGMDAFQHLQTMSDMPDAIITTNDFVASGIISAARLHGLHIPNDLAVVGFQADESQVADAMQLTHVTNPLVSMGQNMFNIFLNTIKNKNDDLIRYDFELIVRHST